MVIAVPTYDCVAMLAGIGKFDSWLPSPINAPAVIEAEPKDKLPDAMFDKSDFKKFLAWLVDNPKYFSKGSDGVFRAVIFSHGHFLKGVFGLNFDVKNNEAIHTKIDTDKPDSIGKRFEFWPVNKDFGLADCPNDCRFSYCETTI